MEHEVQAAWDLLVDDAIREAERRLRDEEAKASRRAVQLAREQAYHRLAAAIDKPKDRRISPRQLKLFEGDPTLFDD